MNLEEELFESLKLSGLTESQANKRSHQLADDIRWINFDQFSIHIENSGIINPETDKSIPLIEYYFGETQFSSNNARNSKDKRAPSIDGSLLNRGNLRLFSIVSDIGRNHLSNSWHHDEGLRFYLRTPAHHLNALNEVWWLGRFKTATCIESRHHMHSGPEDIDWRFNLEGTDMWINLEVKNRPTDIRRHIHGVDVGVKQWLADTTKKFTPSKENEINLVGLTIFGQIDRRVQHSIADWISKQKIVDGVIIWSHEGRLKCAFDKQFRNEKSSVLTHLITPPVEENELVFRYWSTVDRNLWPKELQDSLPPDL